jgi:hypothetical protein
VRNAAATAVGISKTNDLSAIVDGLCIGERFQCANVGMVYLLCPLAADSSSREIDPTINMSRLKQRAHTNVFIIAFEKHGCIIVRKHKYNRT